MLFQWVFLSLLLWNVSKAIPTANAPSSETQTVGSNTLGSNTVGTPTIGPNVPGLNFLNNPLQEATKVANSAANKLTGAFETLKTALGGNIGFKDAKNPNMGNLFNMDNATVKKP